MERETETATNPSQSINPSINAFAKSQYTWRGDLNTTCEYAPVKPVHCYGSSNSRSKGEKCSQELLAIRAFIISSGEVGGVDRIGREESRTKARESHTF